LARYKCIMCIFSSAEYIFFITIIIQTTEIVLRNSEIQLTKDENQKKNTVLYSFSLRRDQKNKSNKNIT
jgi:hypothetical protein